jgi:hypothetical protein
LNYLISGFECDFENMRYPIICVPGFFRKHLGPNNIPDIESKFGSIFDFIDSSKPFFNEYRTFYINKYLGVYHSEKKTDYTNAINFRCLICPPGYYCPKGAHEPLPCPRGHYCESQSGDKMPCKQGYYNQFEKQYKCKECDFGFICPYEMMESYLPCPSGFICNNTRIGTTFYNHEGTVFNKAYACPVGHYCPEGSLSLGPKCKTGNRCPAGSATMEPCLPGTYQDEEGQDRCILCPYGHTCFNSTTTIPSPCRKGRVCDQRGLISPVKLCPDGLVCLERVGIISTNGSDIGLPINRLPDDEELRFKYPFISPDLCPRGHFCKKGTEKKNSESGILTTPQPCNIGEYNDLEGQAFCKQCPAGFECPEKGLSYRIPCREGFYRQFDPTILSCVPCPEGTYGEFKSGYASTKNEIENNQGRPGFTSVANCTDCPPGVVCTGLNLTLNSFRCNYKYLKNRQKFKIKINK